MGGDFRDESEAHEFIAWHFRERGKVHKRRRVQGLGLPDIDVLVEAGELVGYEVKYFPTREAVKPYEGVGEALALLLYGVDRAYLLHVFDSGIGGEAGRARNQVGKLVGLLPIGYAYCIGRGELRVVKEACANPFLGDPEVRRARERLLEALY